MKRINLRKITFAYFLIISISLMTGINLIWIKTFSLKDQTQKESLKLKNKNPQLSIQTLWDDNGTAICTEARAQEYSQVISDGTGGAIIVWQDRRSITDYDIYGQRIDSKGNRLWDTNGIIISNASFDQMNPQIDSDGAGGAIITWNDNRSGSDYDIYAQRIDLDGNPIWKTNGIPISNKSFPQWNPQITSDGVGGAIITWEDGRSGETFDIYAQKIHANGSYYWKPNGTLICNASSHQFLPQITSDGVGGAIIAWEDHRNGLKDIFAQKINVDGHVQWKENGTVICNDTGPQGNLQIINDGAGGAIITWEDGRNGPVADIFAQKINIDGHVQWKENGTVICNDTGPQGNLQIINDGAGGAIITWEDGRSGVDFDIYAQKVFANGSNHWKLNGTVICNASMDQNLPQIATDGIGGAIIVWEDMRSGTYLDIFAQQIDLNGMVQWINNGIVICNADRSQGRSHIINDGSGGAIFVWDDSRNTNNDIYAQRLSPNGISQWEAYGSDICTTTKDQEYPQIISDGAGGSIIIWRDNRSVNGFDIYAQRVDRNGIAQWNDNGIPICTVSNDQNMSQICSDGMGGAIITWQDYRSGSDFDIYAQRVSHNGMILWNENGIPICTEINNQYEPIITTDGLGGAIISWYDYRNGSNYDIYAQRVDLNGVPVWKNNGTVICNATFDQLGNQLTSDGLGGAILTWHDNRSGLYYDVYAQRINSKGLTQWDDNGTVVCNATENQGNIHMANDGMGGAIIGWEDFREGMPKIDIYSQRINSIGVVQWKENGIVICNETGNQKFIKIASDGGGGGIFTWQDKRNGPYWDIYAQRVDYNGTNMWLADGIAVCTESYDQSGVQLISDGTGGVVITWRDFRSGIDNDIYAQKVDSTGNIQWTDNGTAICTVEKYQTIPKLCSDGVGGAIITWEDARSGVNYDIYAQRIKNAVPTSNHPNLVNTDKYGTETIKWTLYDDFGGGEYRVLANYTGGNYYIQENWTEWNNGIPLEIEINRTSPGIYEYTIEFYDNDYQFGIPDTVIVDIYDNYEPIITIYTPSSTNNLFGETEPTFTIGIVETSLDSTWYTLDNGSTNITFSGLSGNINRTEWEKKSNGTFSIDFYANDTNGNIGTAGVTVRKDILAPIIAIDCPEPNEKFDVPPAYEISIDEGNLDKIWYTLDGGLTNISITSLSGTINEDVWEALSGGSITIQFYASDLLGNIGTAEVSIIKIKEEDRMGDIFWQILISAIGAAVAGVVGIVFFLIKRKLKKRSKVSVEDT